MATDTQITSRVNAPHLEISPQARILIVCLPGIGDALMATPMIRHLKKSLPNCRIDIVYMFTGVGYIFKNNPAIHKSYFLPIYTSKLKSLKLILELRQKKYDFSILAFPTYRREYHILHFLLGAKKRIAHVFHQGFYKELNFLESSLVEVDESSHNVINNLALLTPLGIKLPLNPGPYVLKIDHGDIDYGKKYLIKIGWHNKKVLSLHPGSTNSPAAKLRRWPTGRYSQIVNYLTSLGFKILIFTGPDEEFLAQEIIAKTKDKTSVHLVNNLPLGKSLGILNQSLLLVANDNGFGHLAVALGKKLVTLWASTNPKWSLPFQKELVTLIQAPQFIPWYRYELKRQVPKGKTSGMDLITVGMVKKALQEALRGL